VNRADFNAETEAFNRRLEEQEQMLAAQRWALGMLLALQQARLEREWKQREGQVQP